jgi:hypothetical protein
MKALCACLFTVALAATGAGFGVYFYLQVSGTTTTSTSWATSAPTTSSHDISIPEIVTEANVIVVTSQGPSETTTSVGTTEQLQDMSATELDIEANVLCRGMKLCELPETDRRKFALDWLLNDDKKQLAVTDSNLYQRFILALLAFNFGSDFTSSVDWLSNVDKCKWYGVTCDGSGEVSKLELGKFFMSEFTFTICDQLSFLRCNIKGEKYLEGTVPPEISGLQYLDKLLLNGNYISGTLPSELGLLSPLATLYLHDTEFNWHSPFRTWSFDIIGFCFSW